MPLTIPVPSMEVVTSARLVFRRPVIEDAHWWMEYINDAEAIRFMALRLGDPEDARRFVQRALDRAATNGSGLNVISDRSTKMPVGMAGLLVQEVDGVAELEIGYHLLPSAWGRGFALEAAARCREFAREAHVAGSVISLIDPRNLRSQRVAIRNGLLPQKIAMHRGTEAIVFRHSFGTD